MIQALDIQSEQYSASGNIAAEGFKKLLGSPALDLLRIVIREALQNSCDAAGKNGPTVKIRLRQLTEGQMTVLNDQILSNLPVAGDSRDEFQKLSERQQRWVLEICDFGTSGLTGPIRADEIPENCEDTDFIDFTRNIGSRRDTHEGGGTYGYGKSSLYLSSVCSTILIDSQTTNNKVPVRRFIGCHLGNAFDFSEGNGYKKRYTGRHWWGRKDKDEVADPLEGNDAVTVCDALGFYSRDASKPGTSIMILDPIFLEGEDSDPPNILVRMIAETVLWNFWPRMMTTTNPAKKLTITLGLNEENFKIPSPEQFPPLDLYCNALNKIRNKSDGLEPINAKRPQRFLGYLSLERGLKADRTVLLPKSKSIFPETASHIAIMRPVELVVKYMEGIPLPGNRFEWGGVFVCDSGVEKSFADAEPPAHDDWIPDKLPKGSSKTFVNVALRELKKWAATYASPGNFGVGAESIGPSLAAVSGTMGQFLNDDVTNRGGAGEKIIKTKRSTSRRKNFFTRPEFKTLKIIDGERAAIYSFECKLTRGSELKLEAITGVVLDGKVIESVSGKKPVVLHWSPEGKETTSNKNFLELKSFTGKVDIAVSIPGDFAISLGIREV